jgi:hypothetical protein
LNWTRGELSKKSGVSAGAIRGFEIEATTLMRLNHVAVRQAFEEAGVQFLGKTGVEMRGGS